MDVDGIARELLERLGGRENIVTNDACATRLRVGVRDASLVDVEGIGGMEDVLGVVEVPDGVQVVLGPGVVGKVLDAFATLTGLARGTVADGPKAVPHEVAKMAGAHKGGRVHALLKRIADVFVPLLPGVIAAGLVNGITNVIGATAGSSLGSVWWYAAIRTIGWALFAYLPILVGANASRVFGGTAVLGAVIGALCVANTNMPLLATTGDAGIVLPMTGEAYNPAHGGLMAALVAGSLAGMLERWVRSWMPALIDTFATPLLVLTVATFAVVCVLQPVCNVLTDGVYALMSLFYDGLGAVGGYFLAATFLPLVSVGLHQALTPIHVMLNDPSGPTGGINYLLPVLMMAGGGQLGAGLALLVRSKNARLRGLLRDALPVGALGIGEPLMYAVTLPLGRPFVCACLGAGFGGALATVLHVGCVSQGVSGIFGLLIVQAGSQLAFLASLLVAVAGGFVLTWLFGVDEERIGVVFDG